MHETRIAFVKNVLCKGKVFPNVVLATQEDLCNPKVPDQPSYTVKTQVEK